MDALDPSLMQTDEGEHGGLQQILTEGQPLDIKYPQDMPPPTPNSAIHPDLGGSQPAELETPPKAETSRVGKAPASASSASKSAKKDGTVTSVFSGNRLRFLKKDDGEPFWRVDIQYLFLRYVFEDEQKVFTKYSDGTTGHTFADIYIDAMAKSSKCSQILKDKLLTDRVGAIDMAMICLLVNVGRMNTTLNFFPEMRARVRTYHPIPSLQAKQSSQAYKQLQDGPRLKSILKGAQEGKDEEFVPATPDDILKAAKPRTNPVNLIFVLSQYAPKVSETHFPANQDFFDIFIRTTMSSRSRATAFLWLLWWYLESDFTPEAALSNPFGPGVPEEEGASPLKVPTMEMLTEQEALAENIDTEDEVAFGEAKKVEREAILANDMPPTAAAPKRGTKTALMEHQHNYRFRVSPYSGGSRSGSDAGSQGRASQSPPPEEGLEGSAERIDRDATRSPSPSVKAVHHQNVSASSPAGPSPPGSSRINKVTRDNFSRPVESMEPDDVLQSSQPAPVESSSRPFIFRSPNDPDLGTPQNVTNNLGTILPGYWVALNGPEEQHVSPAPDRGGNNKRRLPSQNQQAADKSRRDRAAYVLDQSMRATQRGSLRERRHRGVIVDAWLKCRTLPDGYDSEDEKIGRAAGPVEVTEEELNASEAAKSAMVGDIGAQDEVLAKAWRKLGRNMGIPAFTRRSRTTLHRAAVPKAEHDEEVIVLDDVEAAKAAEVVIIDDSEAAAPGANSAASAKRKRAPAKRKSRAAVVAEGDATPRASPSSRAAPSTGGRRRTTVKKPGSEGVPLKDWNGKEDTPTTAAKKSTSRRVASIKHADKQDEDEMDHDSAAAHQPAQVKDEQEQEPPEDLDAELLGDAAEADEGEGEEVPDDEEAAELLMGMTGSGKEHGAAVMMEAEKALGVEKGQGEVDMVDA